MTIPINTSTEKCPSDVPVGVPFGCFKFVLWYVYYIMAVAPIS